MRNTNRKQLFPRSAGLLLCFFLSVSSLAWQLPTYGDEFFCSWGGKDWWHLYCDIPPLFFLMNAGSFFSHFFFFFETSVIHIGIYTKMLMAFCGGRIKRWHSWGPLLFLSIRITSYPHLGRAASFLWRPNPSWLLIFLVGLLLKLPHLLSTGLGVWSETGYTYTLLVVDHISMDGHTTWSRSVGILSYNLIYRW